MSTKTGVMNGLHKHRKGGTGEGPITSGHGSWSNSRDINTAHRDQQKRNTVTGPVSYTNFTIGKKGKR